jgi:ferredoxin-type protein NapF
VVALGESQAAAEHLQSIYPRGRGVSDAMSKAGRTSSQRPACRQVARIGSDCLAMQGVVCRICAQRCPEHAIRFRRALGGYALPEVDLAACDGCGSCLDFCPGGSIEMVVADS